MNSMNASPAISSDVRVHRVHEMHRSRSSSTSVEMGTGLSKVRLSKVNRVSPRPLDMAWFCSGHSPPLSHIGQSSGWLISSSSITPCWALSAASELNWVCTTMSSVTGMVHDAIGLRWPSISTRHWRQAPTGSNSGWSQNRGISTPINSAARITKVPLGTLISVPSIVNVTSSGWETFFSVSATCVISAAPPHRYALHRRRRVSRVVSVRREHGQLGVERTSAALDVRDVFVAEEFDRRRDRARRAIAQGAERLTENRIGDIQQLVQVFGSAVTGLQAVVDLTQPERAFAEWRALAARLVLVEVDPPADRAHHAGGLVENLQRLGAQHRPG